MKYSLIQIRIGMLRQWLNEDRIEKVKNMVTNEQIAYWLELGECTHCKAPFLPHHHIHITRKGTYHTKCYKVKYKKI